jgi:hypothetical protein
VALLLYTGGHVLFQEFNDLSGKALSDMASVNALWASLLSSGQLRVQALLSSLAPVAAALQSAQPYTAAAVVIGDGEDGEDDQPESPRGARSLSVPPAITSAVMSGLPESLTQCELLQGWGSAVEEATAAQVSSVRTRFCTSIGKCA